MADDNDEKKNWDTPRDRQSAPPGNYTAPNGDTSGQDYKSRIQAQIQAQNQVQSKLPSASGNNAEDPYVLTRNMGAKTISEMYAWFWGLSDKQWKTIAGQLVESGFLTDPNADQEQVWQQYYRVLKIASQRYYGLSQTLGGRQISENPATKATATVEDIINSYQKNPIGEPKQDKLKPYATTSLNLATPEEANAAFTDMLKQRIGREPTESEKQKFLADLLAAQRANPTKTQFTPTADGQHYNTVTSGGVNPQGFADTYAQDHNQAEYEAYQTAGTYFPALLQAIGAVV